MVCAKPVVQQLDQMNFFIAIPYHYVLLSAEWSAIGLDSALYILNLLVLVASTGESASYQASLWAASS